MNNLSYIVSNRYHIFTFNNTLKIVSIDFESFHAEINIDCRNEYTFFKKIFSSSNSLNEIRIFAKNLQINIDLYLPLIETLINKKILIEKNLSCVPAKTISNKNSFLYLPKAPKDLHKKWFQYFKILKEEYENIIFSPVFSQVQTPV